MIWILALNLVFTVSILAVMVSTAEERMRKEYMRGYADGAETILNGEYTSLDVEMETEKD